jgi:phenylalanyl-tRNA synthetase beta chain
LIETGLCFIQENGKLVQVPRLGGIICGRAQKEQWGISSRKVDFYDLKGHLCDIFGSMLTEALSFKKGEHPALHPGQTAYIYLQDECIGVMGALHPSVSQALDLSEKAFVFEIDLAKLHHLGKSLIQEVSKFPEIRRDIAILVNQTIPADKIQDTIKVSAGDWLKDVFIFDVYHGKGISPDLKSIALALIWQHPTRTLVDEEVTDLMELVTGALKGQLGAELRS